jgi:hypothetical protein
MLTIHRSRLPADEATVRAALAQYQAALAQHAESEGVAAPWPALEILREIVAQGGSLAVVDDPAPAPVPLVEQLEAAVQVHLDTAAKARGYDSIFTAVTYADEASVPRFQREGQRLRTWRSLVWEAAAGILGDVQAGRRLAPTAEQLLAELPTISWDD